MKTLQFNIEKPMVTAGLAQIVLSFGSLLIPKILNWHGELIKVRPLIKRMFWTYSGYILGINLSFGLLSVFDSRDLTNASPIATTITGFIALYWISRIFIQFFYFDRTDFPTGKWNKLGEISLVALFICLSIVYSLAFYTNYNHI